MKWPRFPEVDWRRALGEVALIFFGITLALLFDNWNEDRRERILERQILAEIREDLVETRKDLESDIANSRRRLGLWRDLSAAIASDASLDDAWVAKLRDTTGASSLVPKTSGYRALTSQGLGILSDGPTRKAITDFYELRLARVALFEERTLPFYRDVYLPFVRSVTRIPDEVLATAVEDRAELPAVERYDLRDPAGLSADPRLIHHFFDMSSDTRRVLGRYEEALVEIDQLVARIDQQLAAD
jgi:hypothetical protein